MTDVLEANAKLPASSSNGTGEIFLKPKMICQWPKHLVLNVVTEDSKQERVIKIQIICDVFEGLGIDKVSRGLPF